MNRAEFVVAMTKGNGRGGPFGPIASKVRTIWLPLCVQRPCCVASVFADVQGGENRRAIGGQVEGEDPSRRIGRRRVTLISTGKISLLAPGKANGAQTCRGPGWGLHFGAGAADCQEPAERQQATR